MKRGKSILKEQIRNECLKLPEAKADIFALEMDVLRHT